MISLSIKVHLTYSSKRGFWQILCFELDFCLIFVLGDFVSNFERFYLGYLDEGRFLCFCSSIAVNFSDSGFLFLSFVYQIQLNLRDDGCCLNSRDLMDLKLMPDLSWIWRITGLHALKVWAIWCCFANCKHWHLLQLNFSSSRRPGLYSNPSILTISAWMVSIVGFCNLDLLHRFWIVRSFVIFVLSCELRLRLIFSSSPCSSWLSLILSDFISCSTSSSIAANLPYFATSSPISRSVEAIWWNSGCQMAHCLSHFVW